MDIMLLGPELENAQNDARKELSNEIERRKQEVEKEVVETLSAIATDGKRVLKSQIKTYEMMLQLDGLVKENEALFLEVNALCTKTGISLSAIIDRMVEKNRQMREAAPAEEVVEIPNVVEDKKKVTSQSEDVNLGHGDSGVGLNYSLNPSSDLVVGGEDLPLDIPEWPEDDYDPDVIKYDWQKSTFSLDHDGIIQDLPVESTEEQTFSTPGMKDEEIKESQSKLGFTNFEATSKPELKDDGRFQRIIGRRLFTWGSTQDKISTLLRASVCCESARNASDEYRAINAQIGDLLMSYRFATPEEDNLRLDALDQMIGSSGSLDTSEKRRLYGRLNRSAKKVENHARTFAGSRK